MRCAFVSAQRGRHRVKLLCRGLGIGRSTYYAWQSRPPSRRAIEDARLLREIQRIYQETGGAYGSPRMHEDLTALGFSIGKKRVERLMRIHRLEARQFRRARRHKKGRASQLAPNLVKRQFYVEALNTIWVSDITQIWTRQGWLYLSAVMDLCSRRIVGWATSSRPNGALVRRLPSAGMVHHSDQGTQYGSIAFQRLLTRHGLRCSMSHKGTFADNAVAESFFSSLKRERTHGTPYVTRDEARRDLFNYIEVFYNRRRRHSTLGQISPADFERRLACP